MTTYSVYIGTSSVRKIAAADWTSLAIANTGDTTWNATNSYAIDQATLSAGQITYLAAQADFLTGQATVRQPSQVVANPSGYLNQSQVQAMINKIVSSTGISVPSDWGATGGWKTARAQAGQRRVQVVCMGDSLWDYGSSDFLNTGMWARVLNGLRATYGDGGSGFHSVVNAPGAIFTGGAAYFSTTGGAWTAGGTGINSKNLFGPANGATLTNTHVFGQHVGVFYNSGQSGLGSGSFSVTVDGVVVANIAQAAPMGIGFYSFDTGVVGLHTVVITQTSATAVQIGGVIGRNTAGIVGWPSNHWGRAAGTGGTTQPLTDNAWFSGFQATSAYASVGVLGGYGSREVIDGAVVNGSKNFASATAAFTAADVGRTMYYVSGGTTYVSIIDTYTDATHVVLHDNSVVTGTVSACIYNQPGLASTPQDRIPDLLMINLGINDLTIPTAAATYATNLRSYLAMARSSNPLVDILLIMPAFGLHADASSLYHQYVKEMKNIALTFGAAFIDFGALSKMSWPYWSSLGYWGDGTADGLAGADTIHMSDVGHAYSANTILSVLQAA